LKKWRTNKEGGERREGKKRMEEGGDGTRGPKISGSER